MTLFMKKVFLFSCIFALMISLYFFRQGYALGEDVSQAVPPNVILIMLDAARADHFSCYGYNKNTTPRMDEIGSQGAIFLNNFSPGTHTVASISEILSSRYFSICALKRVSLYFRDREIISTHSRDIIYSWDDEQIFLPEIFSLHGYRTALIHNHGYFRFGSYLVTKFEDFFPFDNNKFPIDEDIISKAISWIESNKNDRFFIYIHIMSPHAPYPYKDEDKEFMPDKDYPAIEVVRKKASSKSGLKNWSQKEIEYLKMLYNGNLKHSDKWIGILYDKLKELSLEKNTLMIITSDHGENLGEHNSTNHGGPPWDSVIKVPLIMMYSPRIPAGTIAKGLTESIDIMPTIVDICGLKLPSDKSMDGVSLLKFIDNPKKSKECVFTRESIRTNDYKYIFRKGLLYDLKKDPCEIEDISNLKLGIVKYLKNKYDKCMSRYKMRFEDARRGSPFDFPFVVKASKFYLTSEEISQEMNRWEIKGLSLNKDEFAKAWKLDLLSSGLNFFNIYGEASAPAITLSLKMTDGVYDISLVVETFEEILFNPEEFGFRYRFSPEEKFSFPKSIKSLEKVNEDLHASLVNLGKSEVEKERFYVELKFEAFDKKKYMIREVLFASPRHKAEELSGETREEHLNRLENLRSLGYL